MIEGIYKNYSVSPFMPEHNGDSGHLHLATKKSNATIQYVLKHQKKEDPCNEFMYHYVAKEMGLHTPDVFLCQFGSDTAVAIRFIPDLVKLPFPIDNTVTIIDYCAFEIFFAIMCEEDSHEYYLDGARKLFKLDNAGSFANSLYLKFVIIGYKNVSLCANSLDYCRRTKYEIRGVLKYLRERYSQIGFDAAINCLKAFVCLDTTQLEVAYRQLDEVYPKEVSDYYRAFIDIRKEVCREVLAETD